MLILAGEFRTKSINKQKLGKFVHETIDFFFQNLSLLRAR